jgi:AmmeMemoRadiSam system protein B
VYLDGLAVPSVDAFETPLGNVPLDREAIERVLALPATSTSDQAHAQEHCLEVQLPFLQVVLSDFTLVPILVGRCPVETVARVLESLWDAATLVIVSSDLSHYHSYEEARQLDDQTSARILAREDGLHGEEACGAAAINGLMRLAKDHDLVVTALDVRNSGDTAGDRQKVVGYGAYVLH